VGTQTVVFSSPITDNYYYLDELFIYVDSIDLTQQGYNHLIDPITPKLLLVKRTNFFIISYHKESCCIYLISK